jgi:SAM-dependent methyltransferase
LIRNLNITQWSLRLALKARLPLWKPEPWRALAGLIKAASALDPQGGSSRDRVLRAAVIPAKQLDNTPMPVALGMESLRRTAEQVVARTSRLDLADLLRVDEATRIAAFWNKNVGRHREPFAHWESPRPIAEALNMLVSGESRVAPPQWFMTNYGPFNQVAELGCGDGVLTHLLLHDYPGLTVDAYDLSEVSLERSRASIATVKGALERCRLLQIDLNNETLSENTYDAVFATGTMHHIEKLDFCFRNIRRALKPGGLLWLNDYVGPNQYQWSDTQMRLADELLAIVPRVWRLRDRVMRCDAGKLHDLDPSEAVAPQHIPSALRAHFDIVKTWARGGTLLAPIFGSGCLDSAMAASEEGAKVLAGMFRAEQELIVAGALPSDNYLYIAKPRPDADQLIRTAFEPQASPFFRTGQLGIKGDINAWINLNQVDALQSVVARDRVAPFPPPALMHRTSGLSNDSDFAAHGAVILRALAAHSPEPIGSYRSILDFGIGAGRLARMFKGFDGRYVGVDIDELNIDWVKENLPWVEAQKTESRHPFPFPDSTFDAVFSISVFTHMNELDHLWYLDELRRVAAPGARLFVTIAGERALQRAENEPNVLKMLAMPTGGLDAARAALRGGSGFCFLRQRGHLTSNAYEYGITFISDTYIKQRWLEFFELETVAAGGIHNFQDIAVLRRRAN